MNYKKLSVFLATFIGIFLCFTFVAARISNPSSGGSQTPWASNIDGGGYSITNVLSAIFTNATTTNATTTNLAITGLGTAAGTYVAIDPNGLVIATTTPVATSASSTLLEDINTWTALNTFANSTSTLGTVDTFWSTTGSITTLTATYASTTAVTGNLYDANNHKVYTRWKDGASIVQPTTTDEVYKLGNCLEPSGPSVTIDKVSSIIASTTSSSDAGSLVWNIYVADTFSSSSPWKLIDVDETTNATSSQTSTTTFNVATIPSGYCWWFVPVSAGTLQIGAFNFNLYGYED